MTSDTRQQAIRLYDRFTHDGMERRAFMAQMVKLAGSAAAAELLIAGIAPSAAAAAIVAENDPRLAAGPRMLAYDYRAYVAEPRTRALRPTVLVIHENRGLNDHIRDVTRRVALAGFRAVAPDLLSHTGGTPRNDDAARDAIGKLNLGVVVHQMTGILDELARSSRNGKVGALGFCWGGGFVDRLAVDAGARLAAGVSYYGPAPAPAEAAKVSAPLMLHLAGLDDRVGATAWPFAAALGKAGKAVELFEYPGVNHAFNNDTAADRFNRRAADLAWGRTIAFFKRQLG
ncbi:MAG: dienelactone hydrolase family protein [Sphingomicrobium sp.]